MSEGIGRLMEGKRGLIMGLANDRSLAWGIARALGAHGAELAFSYQGEALEKRVRPLAMELGSDVLIDCDVSDMRALDVAFDGLKERWPTLDFVVRAGSAYLLRECSNYAGFAVTKVSIATGKASLLYDAKTFGKTPRWLFSAGGKLVYDDVGIPLSIVP